MLENTIILILYDRVRMYLNDCCQLMVKYLTLTTSSRSRCSSHQYDIDSSQNLAVNMFEININVMTMALKCIKVHINQNLHF